MNLWRLFIVALAKFIEFIVDKFGRKTKEREKIQKTFDEAVDSGNRRDIIDTFNRVSK